MHKDKLTILILAVNETSSLEETVKKISIFSFIEDIFIISPKFITSDCRITQKKIIKNFKKLNIKSLIQPIEYPGYGGAIKFGLNLVNSKYFTWIDADGETDPTYLKKMYEIISQKKSINFVNASRYYNKNILVKDYGLISSLFTFCFQQLCRLFFSKNITDFTAGYRIYDSEFFKKFKFKSNDQNFALETILLPLLDKDINCSEVPYTWVKRNEGVSSNSFFKKFSYFKILFKMLFIKLIK